MLVARRPTAAHKPARSVRAAGPGARRLATSSTCAAHGAPRERNVGRRGHSTLQTPARRSSLSRGRGAARRRRSVHTADMRQRRAADGTRIFVLQVARRGAIEDRDQRAERAPCTARPRGVKSTRSQPARGKPPRRRKPRQPPDHHTDVTALPSLKRASPRTRQKAPTAPHSATCSVCGDCKAR